MKINFEKKQIVCDCGRINGMDTVPIVKCPCCDKLSVGCSHVSCGFHEITPHVYNYIDSYQEYSKN